MTEPSKVAMEIAAPLAGLSGAGVLGQYRIATAIDIAREEGRRAGLEEADKAVAACPSLDENGYICQKAAAMSAIRALAARPETEGRT